MQNNYILSRKKIYKKLLRSFKCRKKLIKFNFHDDALKALITLLGNEVFEKFRFFIVCEFYGATCLIKLPYLYSG